MLQGGTGSLNSGSKTNSNPGVSKTGKMCSILKPRKMSSILKPPRKMCSILKTPLLANKPTSQNMNQKTVTPVMPQALFVNNNSIRRSLLRTPDGRKPLTKDTRVIRPVTSSECSSPSLAHSVHSTKQSEVIKSNILGTIVVKAEGLPPSNGIKPSLQNEHGLNTNSETMIKRETGEMEHTEKAQVGTPPLKRRRLAECKVEVKVEDDVTTGIPPVPRHASGLKPHECTVCVEGFTSEHLMIQHLQTVPVETSNSCVKGFDKVNNLGDHINLYTPRALPRITINPNSLLGHREETDVTPSTSQVTASPQIPQPTNRSVRKPQHVRKSSKIYKMGPGKFRCKSLTVPTDPLRAEASMWCVCIACKEPIYMNPHNCKAKQKAKYDWIHPSEDHHDEKSKSGTEQPVINETAGSSKTKTNFCVTCKEPMTKLPHDCKEKLPSENQSVQERLTDDVALYSCPYCTESYSDVKQLEDHIKIHKGNQPETISRPADAVLYNSSSVNYQCFDCPLIVESSVDLLKHAQLHTGIKLYGCTDCGEGFTELSQHNIHYKSHDVKEKFYCDVCTNWYETKLILEFHHCRKGEVYPPAGFKFKCPNCTRGYLSRYSLLSHFITHTPVRPYACTICGVGFKNISKLFQHVDNHMAIRELDIAREKSATPSNNASERKEHMTNVHVSYYQCFDCPRSFQSFTQFVEHVQVHSGVKPYQCPDCGEKFTEQRRYHLHHRSHAKDDKFYCDVCTNRYETKIMLDYHQCKEGEVYPPTGDSRFHCCNCQRNFPSRFSLLSHFITHTPVRPYVCTICGVGFKNISKLFQHVDNHMAIRKLDIAREKSAIACERPATPITRTASSPVTCSICSVIFPNASQCKTHLADVHVLYYLCFDCPLSFESFTELVEHAQEHTGVKPYQCLDCGEKFTEQRRFRSHYKSHDKDEKFHCDVCSNYYTSKVMLDHHLCIKGEAYPVIVTNKDQLRVKCCNCAKHFISNSSMVSHFFTHTTVRRWWCTICDLGFNNHFHLLEHVNVHMRTSSRFLRKRRPAPNLKQEKDDVESYNIGLQQ